MVAEQGRHQGMACGPDFSTDVHPSDGRLFASQVVLQGLVAGVCKFWFDTGGLFSGIKESLWLALFSCCTTRVSQGNGILNRVWL